MECRHPLPNRHISHFENIRNQLEGDVAQNIALTLLFSSTQGTCSLVGSTKRTVLMATTVGVPYFIICLCYSAILLTLRSTSRCHQKIRTNFHLYRKSSRKLLQQAGSESSAWQSCQQSWHQTSPPESCVSEPPVVRSKREIRRAKREQGMTIMVAELEKRQSLIHIFSDILSFA